MLLHTCIHEPALALIDNSLCPETGETLQLRGLEAFDAAAHCAAVSAGKRLKQGLPQPGEVAQESLEALRVISNAPASSDSSINELLSNTFPAHLQPLTPPVDEALIDDADMLHSTSDNFVQQQDASHTQVIQPVEDPEFQSLGEMIQ